ncbi:M3 family metallopeptidase [Shewanella oneidensis MR-1]|uniref:Dipepidyl carboxypeptidase II Dcp n=1 Tax=Shewanella oneidensis (strain ATCC 700550 / JCM 31522 / CIP 106686 / LMG 19005 / NCIMB 14063 / MR-1) TaxID=211586 RepID=Q8ECJ9_SHEON|nr:M3 family metallopeptidase [Shewanella oneidensis]AAN56143.1 dipepidyl carboxypeptidase II Dcp [Shewanella oneidensis MR-1]MDX5999425.1 M3 family metallopeptidase [Shewanella oneidensis]MEE2026475.1 Dipeptidyl carboxypeptidase [Shewanella oneidensis]QKG97577.1 M3 family metallopeptidase [Shewanella oneidensis MR-1]
MRKSFIAIAIGATLMTGAMTGCSSQDTKATNVTAVQTQNPLFQASTLQYQAPDFNAIKDEHFQPALEQGIKEQYQEILTIANNPAAPTFDNTIVAMEKSGALLNRASSVFYNLAGSNSNPTLRKIQGEMAPKMAAHSDNINLNPALFARIETIYNNRNNLGLTPEAVRLVEMYHQRFIMAGAKLTDEQKVKIRALNEEQSTLTNEFSQRLLRLTKDIAIVVDNKEQLAGLSDSEITSAANDAKAAGHDGKYLINITNTTRQPVLASLENRELRQRIWEASANRGLKGENETASLVSRLAQLRAERAALLGYENWASYRLAPQMAKTPEAVYSMFGSMVPAVVANTEKEAADIQAMINKTGGKFELAPWDWEFYAEKVRQEKYALDANSIRPYFEFNRVLEDGVFYTLKELYGVTLKPRPDLPVYHPDVKAYEMFDADGSSMAIFYADYFAREGKRGGAWMSSFVGQSFLEGTKPVVVNVMNIKKAPEGQPTFVSYNEVTTMFHEMGHGTHGMFSKVTYPSLSGTSVSRDFVEFPSTFEEDWAAHPKVLANYAKHYETGKPIPDELLQKLLKSGSFNQGFDTLEYMAAALVDMEWHSLSPDAPLQDVATFEANALKKHGLNITAVPPRYKSTYFAHAFPGGYSASYYAYMWSEILAADAFAYVQTQGGLNRDIGMKYRKTIREVGNSIAPMEAYKNFRGQEPTTEGLLNRRGLNQTK